MIVPKAHYTRLTQCACGRIALALYDEQDNMIATAEYDPGQWLQVAREIVNKNMELLDRKFEGGEHDVQ